MSLKKLVTAGILTGFMMASGAQSFGVPERKPQEQQLEQVVNGYDFNNQSINAETIQQMLNSTVEIAVEAIYKRRTVDLTAVMNALETKNFDSQELEPGKLGDAKMYRGGSGTIVNKDDNTLEILTAAHLKQGIQKVIVQPFTENLVQVFLLSEINYYLVEQSEEDFRGMHIFNEQNSIKLNHTKSDDNVDLMLLKSEKLNDEKLQKYYAIKLIAEESELTQGNVVYIVGYPTYFAGPGYRSDLSKQLTTGIITGGIENPRPELENLLETSAALTPGNSGGPAFVFKEGTPHLVGIANRFFPGANEIYGIVRPAKINEFLHPKAKSNNPLQNYIPFGETIPKELLEPQNNQEEDSGEDAVESPQGQ